VDPPVTPRPAATVVLVRGGDETLEVLLVRRAAGQRFMAGAWVFPGGAVDRGEEDGDAARRAAGVREVAEEVGIVLPGPDALVPFSRWITPPELPIRFDATFYLAAAPGGATAVPDATEVDEVAWLAPAAALAAGDRDELLIEFPTRRTLEEIGAFASARALLAAAGDGPVQTRLPRIAAGGGGRRIVLPGDPGYPA
jgi:8-oxo-dGTP pyrophosphatase MutT (NUDIX family)